MSSSDEVRRIQDAPDEDLRRRDERERVERAPGDDLRDVEEFDDDPEPGRIQRARERARRRAKKTKARAKTGRKRAELEGRRRKVRAAKKVPEIAKRAASKATDAATAGATAAASATEATEARTPGSGRDDVRRMVEGARDAGEVSPVVGDATLAPTGDFGSVADLARAGPPMDRSRADSRRREGRASMGGTGRMATDSAMMGGGTMLSFEMDAPAVGPEFSDELDNVVNFDGGSLINTGGWVIDGSDVDVY